MPLAYQAYAKKRYTAYGRRKKQIAFKKSYAAKRIQRAFRRNRKVPIQSVKTLVQNELEKARTVSVIYTNSHPSFNWRNWGNKKKVLYSNFHQIAQANLWHLRITDLGNIYKNQAAGNQDSKQSVIKVHKIKCRIEYAIESQNVSENTLNLPVKIQMALVQINDETSELPTADMMGDLNGLYIYRPKIFKEVSKVNYTILKSDTFTLKHSLPVHLDSQASVTQNRVVKHFNYSCNKQLTYTLPNAPDEEQSIKNNIYICIIADQAIRILSVCRVDFTIAAGLQANIPVGIDGADPVDP